MVYLRWLWTNAVCLVIVVTTGFQTVQPPHQKEPPVVGQVSPAPQLAFYLPIEITNRVFTDALLNPTSDEYQTLFKEVSDLLESIYDCLDYNTCPTDIFYRGVTAITFSSGSVIATSTVVFNTYFIDPSIIHFFFITKANNVQPHILQLNLDYTTKDKITLATRATPNTSTATTKPTTTTTTGTTMTVTNTATTTETSVIPTTAITTALTTTSKLMLMFTTTTPITAHKPTTALTSTIKEKVRTASAPTFMMTTTPTTATPTTTSTITTLLHTPATITTPTTTTRPTTTTSTSTASSTTTTITNTTTTTSTAPTTPAFITTTTTTSDLTPPSTQTKTSSDHRIVVSTTKKPLGNQSGIYITNGRKKLAVKTTTVTLQDKHTKSSAKPNGTLTTWGKGNNSWSSDWVPGWGIALLALAAVILMLLIIIFIMMLIQGWKKTQSGCIDTIEDPYYSEKKHPPKDALPIYTSQPPVTQGPGSTPVIFGDGPRKNRFGFYAVNP